MYYYFEHVNKPGHNLYRDDYQFSIEQFVYCNELKYSFYGGNTGISGNNFYHSMSNKKTGAYEPYKIVDQYWLDTSRYEIGYDKVCDYFIKNIIPLLNDEYCKDNSWVRVLLPA